MRIVRKLNSQVTKCQTLSRKLFLASALGTCNMASGMEVGSAR